MGIPTTNCTYLAQYVTREGKCFLKAFGNMVKVVAVKYILVITLTIIALNVTRIPM